MLSRQAIILGVAVIALLLLWWNYCRSAPAPPTAASREGYSNMGDLDNIGSLTNAPNMSIIASPEDHATPDQFAEMVGVDQPINAAPAVGPMERLARCQGSQLLPRCSKGVTA